MGESKRDVAREFHRLQAESRKRMLVPFRGMYAPYEAAESYREKFCSGCSREKKNPKLYFGEMFCEDCVEKWLAGKN